MSGGRGQLEFATIAREAGIASGAGKCAPRPAEAIRGPSRRVGGASAGAGAERPASEAQPPRPRLVAAVYAEEDDGHGNLRLRKVTTTRWLTVRQIADILRVSVQTVYSRIDAKELPAYRIGNAIRVSADDFADYLKIARQGGSEELRALAQLLE